MNIDYTFPAYIYKSNTIMPLFEFDILDTIYCNTIIFLHTIHFIATEAIHYLLTLSLLEQLLLFICTYNFVCQFVLKIELIDKYIHLKEKYEFTQKQLLQLQFTQKQVLQLQQINNQLIKELLNHQKST